MGKIKESINGSIRDFKNKKKYYLFFYSVNIIGSFLIAVVLILLLLNMDYIGSNRLVRIILYTIDECWIYSLVTISIFCYFYFLYLVISNESMPSPYLRKRIYKNFFGVAIISLFVGSAIGMMIESSTDIDQDIIWVDLRYGINNSDSFFDEYPESNPHSTIKLLETDTSIIIEKGRGFRSNLYNKYLLIYFNIYHDKGNLNFKTSDIGRIDVYRHDFNYTTNRFDTITDTFYKKNDINKSVIVKENQISIHLNQDICNSEDSSYLFLVIRKEKNFIYDINKNLVIRGILQDKPYEIEYDPNYELTYYDADYSIYYPYTNSIRIKTHSDSKYDASIRLRNKNFDRVYLIYSIFISVFFGSLFSYFITKIFTNK